MPSCFDLNGPVAGGRDPVRRLDRGSAREVPPAAVPAPAGRDTLSKPNVPGRIRRCRAAGSSARRERAGASRCRPRPKTRAAKGFADGLNASFARIQCTPDLMPADITGTPVWRPGSGTFEFVAGPVFHSIVLVDEINRAPPKVQSALLEAMAERQVTAGSVTYPLPDPFLVLATRNPIEQEGTYPLPEAELDRFLLHVILDLPDAPAERRILDLVERESVGGLERAPVRVEIADVKAARAAARRVHLAP